MDAKRIKVAWICTFTSVKFQKILNPKGIAEDFAPWITNFFPYLEKDQLLETHVISPNNFGKFYTHLVQQGISFHFFRPTLSLFSKRIFGSRISFHFNLYYQSWKIKRIINRIKPDIIHVHGTDGTHSFSVMQFLGKYPVLITIQGFVSYASQNKEYFTKCRIRNEQRILKSFSHFGYRTHTMGKDIKAFNPDAVLHWHNYPITKIEPIPVPKDYDLVFFARVKKDKGIEDLILALEIVKKIKPKISLIVIGRLNDFYFDQLKKLARDSGVDQNIVWVGYLPDHKSVFRVASTARISVLPTYHDIISGTIIESMFLKLPVIAYDVGSIHEVNDSCNYISLVPKCNIYALADAIIKDLKNYDITFLRAEAAYNRAVEMTDNTNLSANLLNAYKAVIDGFTFKR